MTTRDEQVGQALATLRGARSQKAVADQMRGRGWKWSQATVWSVETGERPLRLLEAEDLAEVLEVEIDDFLGDKSAAMREVRFQALLSILTESKRQLEVSAWRILGAQDELRALAELMGIEIAEDKHGVPMISEEFERGHMVHHALTRLNPSEAVRVAEHQYERFVEDPNGSHRRAPIKIALEGIRGEHQEED